jgi:hypothetical protein
MAQLQATGVSGSLAISGSVGIGTISPARTLHVVGQAAFDMSTAGVVVQDSSGVSQIVSYKQTGATYHDLHLRGANLGIAISGSNGYVGVGTTSPNRLLTVSGTQALIGLNATSYRNTTIGSDSVGNFIVYDDTAAAYRMVINSSGNVGIGTTSPISGGGDAKWITLDGNSYGGGFISSVSGTAKGYLYYDSGTATFAMQGASGVGVSFLTSNSEKMRITTGGSVGIGLTNPGAILDVSHTAGTTNIIRVSNGAGNYRWRVDQTFSMVMTNASNVDTFSVNTSGTGYFAGSVGIGTGSPDAILHVAKASAGGVGGQVVIDNPASSTLGNTAEISFLTDTGASGAGTRNARMLAVNENAGNGAANLQFHTWNGSASAERVRISCGGNVGINTSSPTSRLSVCSTTACSTVVDVQGCAGQLFSVTDNLVGDIFSVSDISGIPILNVNSNGTVCVDSKIAVGVNHTVSGAYASITGGRCNTASGNCSTVSGGCGNTASSTYAAVSGGLGNKSEGDASTVAGGRFNTACNGAVFIGGGRANQATGCNSTIAGGFMNLTTGYASSILGGQSNWTAGNFATVVGGFGNTASCYYSVSANRCENTSASCQFRVGALSKASGTFRINHPDPTKSCTHYLSHSFVESPTAGDNIYRYKVNVVNGQAVITLPSYYKYLNENDQIWVTPQGHFGIGYGEVNEQQTQVTIYGNADGEYNVLLVGTRKDHDAAHHWQGVETYK